MKTGKWEKGKGRSRSRPASRLLPPPSSRLPASPGFTLIELLVVIVVLGLLAGLVGPQIIGRVSEAKTTTAKTQLDLIDLALQGYHLDNGSYPTTEQGLEALREKPTRGPIPANWRGPYLRKAVPLDPWGHPYIYKSPGERNRAEYDLITYGRDGKAGGEGEDADIVRP